MAGADFFHCPCKLLLLLCLMVLAVTVAKAQSGEPSEAPKKANVRATTGSAAEPFDGATVERMASQCVTLETEWGAIEMAFMPETAPETVRSFLNMTATGALDTTTFSRVVKGFVIEGGNLATSEKWSASWRSEWRASFRMNSGW